VAQATVNTKQVATRSTCPTSDIAQPVKTLTTEVFSPLPSLAHATCQGRATALGRLSTIGNVKQYKLNLSLPAAPVVPLAEAPLSPLFGQTLLPLQGKGVPVFLSYGLGWDSTCLGLMLLFEPGLRDFALEDFIWITGMTGKEWARTRYLVETFILPLLRDQGVRYIQSARRGYKNKEGIVILSDSIDPQYDWTQCYTDCKGGYNLLQRLIEAGIVPLKANGRRFCSNWFKQFVCDTLVELLVGQHPRRRLIGFRADEEQRALKDRNYGKEQLIVTPTEVEFRYLLGFRADEVKRAEQDQQTSQFREVFEFLLLKWGIKEAECHKYVIDRLKVQWRRSACTFCCFSGQSGSRALMQASFAAQPEAGAEACWLEFVALCMNPTQKLYGKTSVQTLLIRGGNTAAIAQFQALVDNWQHWAVYQVRRVFYFPQPSRKKKKQAANTISSTKKPRKPSVPKPRAMRKTEVLSRAGSQAEALEQLQTLAAAQGLTVERSDYAYRVWVQKRTETGVCTETMWVVCPAVVNAYCRPGFEAKWTEVSLALKQQKLPQQQGTVSAKSNDLAHIVKVERRT